MFYYSQHKITFKFFLHKSFYEFINIVTYWVQKLYWEMKQKVFFAITVSENTTRLIVIGNPVLLLLLCVVQFNKFGTDTNHANFRKSKSVWLFVTNKHFLPFIDRESSLTWDIIHDTHWEGVFLGMGKEISKLT